MSFSFNDSITPNRWSTNLLQGRIEGSRLTDKMERQKVVN